MNTGLWLVETDHLTEFQVVIGLQGLEPSQSGTSRSRRTTWTRGPGTRSRSWAPWRSRPRLQTTMIREIVLYTMPSRFLLISAYSWSSPPATFNSSIVKLKVNFNEVKNKMRHTNSCNFRSWSLDYRFELWDTWPRLHQEAIVTVSQGLCKDDFKSIIHSSPEQRLLRLRRRLK